MLDMDVFMKALRVLESKGKAKIFSDGEVEGVKFF